MLTSLGFLKQHAFRFAMGILALFFVLSVYLALEESNTYDERAHIPAAFTYVDAQDMRLNPEHPPLLKDFAGFPLLLLPVRFPYETDTWQTKENDQWTAGDLFLNCASPEIVCNDTDTISFFARFPIILVGVLLGLGLFFFTRQIGGTLAALLAVVLYAFDPNVIAHSHYVTTDIGIAAFLFFSVAFFVRFLKCPSWKNVLWAGLFLGLAQLTKFSAVLLFPIFGLFTLLFALSRALSIEHRECASFLRCLAQRLLLYVGRFLASVIICFLLIWVVYSFNTANMPGEIIASLANFPETTALGRLANEIVTFTSTQPLLKPWSEYLLGLFMVFGRVASGNTYYFLGNVTNVATPWYFPLIFLMKETLPFLFMLFFSVGYTLVRFVKTVRGENLGSLPLFFARGLENKIAQSIAVFFILFYAFVSITGNLNIGIRHLFPIFPFLFLLVAKTLVDFYRRNEESFGYLLRPIGGLLFLLVMAVPVLSFPSYLSYYNAAFGGHSEGFRYATDSNYDWGQDLKRLRGWIDRHNGLCAIVGVSDSCTIDKIRVDYFGGSNPQYYLGEKFVPWHSNSVPEPGWYAISINFLIENITKDHPEGEPTYAWTIGLTPVGRAGDSIFIFRVPEGGAPNR